MQKRQKIEIAILVGLVIILAIMVWGQIGGSNSRVSVNCQTACRPTGGGWTFPGAGPANQNTFYEQEDCISACQARFQR